MVRFDHWGQSKKLRAAGAYWAGERIKDESLADLKAFGAPAAVIESRKPEDDSFGIWEENWPALEVFLQMQSQWIVGVNGPVGLNYPSLEFLFKLYGKKNRRELFEQVREIEIGALEAIQRTREKAK